MSGNIRPLYMWAGGKSKLLKHYRASLPNYGDFQAYVEPFFGGGALFCDAVNSLCVPRELVINDVNSELVGIYRAIRNRPNDFLSAVNAIADAFNLLPLEERKNFYYELRKKYWSEPVGRVATSATLYALMRLSFNGVWQTCEKSHGKFATPAGLLGKQLAIDHDLVMTWSEVLQDATLSSTDYRHVVLPKAPALIYCDPPYRGSFTSYGTDFGDVEQLSLIDWCDRQAAHGHTVLLSNRNIGDGFFEECLPNYCRIHHFEVTYTAGRRKQTENGFEAKPAREFLAIFNKKNKIGDLA